MRYMLVVVALLLLTACGKDGFKSPIYPSENPGPGCRYIRNANNQWTLSCGSPTS